MGGRRQYTKAATASQAGVLTFHPLPPTLSVRASASSRGIPAANLSAEASAQADPSAEASAQADPPAEALAKADPSAGVPIFRDVGGPVRRSPYLQGRRRACPPES
jgi:hypothetical protein